MRVLLILITLLLVGCATSTEEQAPIIESYLGKNIDDFMLEKDIFPIESEPLNDGGKFYRFKELYFGNILENLTHCFYSLRTDEDGTITEVVNVDCQY